jgi:GNAT superfamily N-acetyltransferase
MKIREAILSDIPQIQIVRNLVKENVLSDPSLVPDSDVADYITRRGKGWVCEIANEVVGFSIIDLQDHNVWALFMHPDFEKQGIGKQLHSRLARSGCAWQRRSEV